MKQNEPLTQAQHDQLETALAAHEARADVNFEMAIALRKVVGGLTGWRKMRSNAKADKILNGRSKILNIVLG